MADIAALEAAESSYAGAASSSSVVPPRAGAAQETDGSAHAGQKRKMRITCMSTPNSSFIRYRYRFHFPNFPFPRISRDAELTEDR